MNDYAIITDSGCDIKPEILKEWGIESIPMTFIIEGKDETYSDYDIPSAEFYAMMRNGAVAKTSAINGYKFREVFAKYAEAGVDIVYLCFSSGLSTTYNVACNTAKELEGEYPERRIEVVDTLCASAGQGLLVKLTNEMKKAGTGIDELVNFVKNTRLNICHWFTVDDLVYLRRGGRVSKASAIVGEILGIKPVLHMSDEGKLVAMSKVRGRRNSLRMIVEKYGELALNPSDGVVFISHGDCIDDAESLGESIKAKYGVEVEYYADIGPIIGAHSGPGTLSLFFVGKQR